ncbi:MAG: polysaccharide biosynthesis protein [Saprospiraceae bacterium]
MNLYNPEEFVKHAIIKRNQSLFYNDLQAFGDELSSKIDGKSVLVIGGAGSIGSSYVKQILNYHPRELVVVDHNENALTELTRDLRSHYNDVLPHQYFTYPIDYGSDLFEKLFDRYSFDIIAHFAAHKHVRSERDILSIESMIINNVFHTFKLLDLCSQKPPGHFFAVSTDKATNPVNIMGASKRLMEMSILAFRGLYKVSTARFANVAFSNGSLLDGFLNRITKNQPISAPSDIRRYFVSAEESGQLCLLGSILSESGDILYPVLQKSDMMSFSEIGQRLLEELGYKIDVCESEDEARLKSVLRKDGNKTYPVHFYKSDTSGEKEEEEFVSDGDEIITNKFQKIAIIRGTKTDKIEDIKSNISILDEAFKNPKLTKHDLVIILQQIVPEFSHLEVGKNLDQRL